MHLYSLSKALYSPLKAISSPLKTQYNPLIRFQKTFFKTRVGDLLAKLEVSRRFQPAIYEVFHEEPESEVQSIQILMENLNFDFKF